MAMVQENLAEGYLDEYDMPLEVSSMEKLEQFPMLNTLSFDASLKDAKEMFHGLGDFNKQMALYSSTSWLLTAAWNVIKQMAPVNPEVAMNIVQDPSLGNIGKHFLDISGFGKVFGMNGDDLKEPGATTDKILGAGD